MHEGKIEEGDLVWFWKSGRQHVCMPERATVARVWNERCLNLIVDQHDGMLKAELYVPVVREDEPMPAGRYCTTQAPGEMTSALNMVRNHKGE